jgi:hypothetical protein
LSWWRPVGVVGFEGLKVKWSIFQQDKVFFRMVRNILWRWDIVLSQDASWISGNGAFRNNWLKILVFFERAFINL